LTNRDHTSKKNIKKWIGHSKTLAALLELFQCTISQNAKFKKSKTGKHLAKITAEFLACAGQKLQAD